MIWEQEHRSGQTLGRMANQHAASGVVRFMDWLKERGVKLGGKAVDIGSGQGRNSVYLAGLGYDVEALEYVQLARELTDVLAEKNNVASRVHAHDVEIDRPWPYPDNTFDLAIDSFSSIDIETKPGRDMCIGEMYRTLKPGGYGLVTVCSADDEWETELIAKHPGPEPNSTLWPQNGKFQKDYTEHELRECYRMFEICELKTISKPTSKLGRSGTATNFWLVVKK